MNIMLSVTISLVAFLIGLELGRWHRRIALYLSAIRSDLRERQEAPKKALETRGEVVPAPTHKMIDKPDMGEESGGVLPMSPRGVALEEAKRSSQ